MSQYALPVLYALLVWWFSTGVVLYIVGLPRSAVRWSMLGAAAVFAASLYGLVQTSAEADTLHTYGAFTFSILLWGAIEVTFLTGAITGPRPRPCSEGCEGWMRAQQAIGAIIYHELALAAAGAAVLALTWGSANQVGAWTFGLLWVMRLSAKLNLFLGVPVLNDQLLPEPVGFLRSYFRRGPVNPLFPISVSFATAVAVMLVQSSLASGTGGAHATGSTLLAALTALAALEHWFMVLPIPAEALWAWAVWSRARGSGGSDDHAQPRRVVAIESVDEAQECAASSVWSAPIISIREAAADRGAAEAHPNRGDLKSQAISHRHRRRT